MRGSCFQPLLQYLPHHVAQTPTLAAAAGSDGQDQRARQIDRKSAFGSGHRPELQTVLCLKKVAIGLSARDARARHKIAQNSLWRLGPR